MNRRIVLLLLGVLAFSTGGLAQDPAKPLMQAGRKIWVVWSPTGNGRDAKVHDIKDVKRWDYPKAESIEVVEEGPVRVAVEVTKKIHNSMLKQRIVLWAESGCVDFETTVDWNEAHKCLKVVFPLDIHTFQARYDIGFGNMDRPTHRTTSWEQAKFEVAAHKWADLSELDYGVSLINDCKYGYDCYDGLLRLTLLRAPKMPNPDSDMYRHEFSYRIYAHAGDWRRAGTVANAWGFNAPLRPVFVEAHKGDWLSEKSWMRVRPEGVVLEACKRAEDKDAIILRTVEHHGRRVEVGIDTDLPGKMIQPVDLIEAKQGLPRKRDGTIELTSKPYEILSVRLD